LRVARNTTGKHGRATDQDVLGVIRERSKVCRNLTIAATLKRLGSRTGPGKPWRAPSVACVRSQYRLPNVPKEQDWLTLPQAAQQLGVSATLLRRLIRQGTLPAHQVVPFAPWIIPRTDLAWVAGQAAVQAGRAGRRRAANAVGEVDVPASLPDTDSAHLVSAGT
jgi:excisionase family DNA binding protein